MPNDGKEDAMFIKFDVSDIAELAEQFSQLSHGGFQAATARALNRSADSVATAVSRQLAEESGLGVRAVRQDVDVVDYADSFDLSAEIAVPGEYHLLGEFDPHETQRGISARPWGQRRLFSGSFELPEGTVVVRQGPERLPLRPLFGPSLAVELERGKSLELAEATVRDVFQRRLDHECERMFQRGAKLDYSTQD
jgi:hypothetical protein